MPKVSIVIPLYNKEKYIARAINSILAQTLSDCEIVVVDDGSTDKSADIVRSFDDSRIHLIQQANAGVSVARNKGIKESKAELVAFLDADDEWMPQFLQEMVVFISKKPVGLVLSNYLNGATGKPFFPTEKRWEGIIPDYFKQVLRWNKDIAFSSALLVRRSCFQKTGIFPVGVAYGEDVDMWNRIAWVTLVGYIPEPLAIYHNTTEGACHAFSRLGPPYPVFLKTFKSWKKEKLISASLLRSSEEYANWTLLYYVRRLIGAKRKIEAFKVFCFECSFSLATGHLYVKIFCLFLVPDSLLFFYRKILKFFFKS